MWRAQATYSAGFGHLPSFLSLFHIHTRTYYPYDELLPCYIRAPTLVGDNSEKFRRYCYCLNRLKLVYRWRSQAAQQNTNTIKCCNDFLFSTEARGDAWNSVLFPKKKKKSRFSWVIAGSIFLHRNHDTLLSWTTCPLLLCVTRVPLPLAEKKKPTVSFFFPFAINLSFGLVSGDEKKRRFTDLKVMIRVGPLLQLCFVDGTPMKLFLSYSCRAWNAGHGP